MSSATIELSRLADLEPGPKRDKLTITLAELIAARSSPADEAFAAIGDLLTSLVVAAARDLRLSVAARIADASWAPRELAVSLALDDFEIAAPVIERCRALLEDDLIVIARRGTSQHRCALAGRNDVSTRVCDALAELAEPEVLAALLRNAAAPLSGATLKTCVDVARDNPALQRGMIARDGLSADLVEALYLIVGEELRAQITARYDLDEAPLRRIIAAAAAERAAPEPGSGDREADALARTLTRENAMSGEFIMRAVFEGRPEMFTHAAAQSLDVPAEDIDGVFRKHGVWAVALAARVCDMRRPNILPVHRRLVTAGMAANATTLEAERVAANVYLSETPASAADRLKRMIQAD